MKKAITINIEKLVEKVEITVPADLMNELEHLRHFRATSVGLWCIDQNPKDVSKEWIEENAFQLTDEVLYNDL